MLLLLLLLKLMMRNTIARGSAREHMTGQLRRQRGNPHAATWRNRARMRVLAFVGRHHDRRVVGGSLHPLLHTAASCGATIIAPVQNTNTSKSRCVAFINYI